MPDVDWEVVRKYRLSNERPPEWPEDVYAISIKGSALLGNTREIRQTLLGRKRDSYAQRHPFGHT